MPVAADLMRCAQELYRRTGQPFLLDMMERVRVQVPDVSGLFHSFPFLNAFTPENISDGATDDASKYFRRMKVLGTGKTIADALALTGAVCHVFRFRARRGRVNCRPYVAGTLPWRAKRHVYR